MISILHTTARPDRWEHISRAWYDACDNPNNVEYVLTYEPNKVTMSLEDIEARLPWRRWAVVACWSRQCAVDGYNLAADAAQGSILLEGQDDLFPCQNWDSLVHDAIPDPTKQVSVRVLEHLDGEVTKVVPHPLITRPYFERYGYLFWPEYESMFSDNEFTDVSERDGVLIDANNGLEFFHRQAGNPDGPSHDDVNMKQLSFWEQSEALYKARKRNNFPNGKIIRALQPLGKEAEKVYIPRAWR